MLPGLSPWTVPKGCLYPSLCVGGSSGQTAYGFTFMPPVSTHLPLKEAPSDLPQFYHFQKISHSLS